MGRDTTVAERRIAEDAVRILNTALPWDQRFQIGSRVALTAIEDIPKDEIHLHFTNGQAGWPSIDNTEERSENTIGWGGARIDTETYTVHSGYAYVDRAAPALRGRRDQFLRAVLHELLHARGFVAHADPDQYPRSILQPRLHSDTNPNVYTTLDGALLQAILRLPVGTNVRDITIADFGDWFETGFYIRGWAPLGGTNARGMIGGVRYRNGLVTPWALGPTPAMRLADNPALGTTVTWTGALVGLTRVTGRTVAGDAAIQIDFDRRNGQADFTALQSWEPQTHPGAQDDGRQWGDGDLDYTLMLWEENTRSGFSSAFAEGDDPGVVTGLLVGTAHEGAAGVLEHPEMAAAFGALRE